MVPDYLADWLESSKMEAFFPTIVMLMHTKQKVKMASLAIQDSQHFAARILILYSFVVGRT